MTWVGTEVNDRPARPASGPSWPTPNGRLRANQFGQAEIQVGTEHKAVVVPKAAVQRKDNVDVVFLPEGDGVYRPQRVVTKPTDRSDVVEVAWGLKPGQTGRHQGGVPAQDGDHEGCHRRRVLRVTSRPREPFAMLNA